MARAIQKRRFSGFWLLASLAVATGLQALIYLMVIEDTIGPFSLMRRPKAADASMSRELRVAVLRSDATAHQFPEHPEYYFNLAQHWGELLREGAVSYRTISDADLRNGLGDSANVLVLPSAACLGEAERRAVAGFLDAGNGVVASGALGTRDGNCEWRGWDFLTQVAGVRNPFSVSLSGNFHAGFRGERYYSENIPAGYSLPFAKQEFVAGLADAPDIYWSDWKLRPAQGTSPAETALGIHAIRGKGRVVWFGFSETLPRELASERRYVDQYLISSVRWAGKQAMAVLGNWPRQRSAAVLVAAEAQPDYRSAEPAAELLRQEHVPAVFFCNPAGAQVEPASLRKFEAAGEIGSASEVQDAAGLANTRRALGGRVAGFSAPQGLAGGNALAAVQSAGFRYYLDDSGTGRAVPQLLDFGSSGRKRLELARIFRAASDDFEVVANYRGPTPWGDDLAEGFLQDFRRTEYLRGLYTLYFRGDLLGAPENLHVLRTLVRKIKADPVWITSGEELVDWWSRREKLRVEARKVGGRRIRVAITNRGQQDVDGASVYLNLPYRPKNVRLTSLVLRRALPRHELLGGEDVLRLDFPRLSAQTSYVMLVALDE